jgi:hypothetical protein
MHNTTQKLKSPDDVQASEEIEKLSKSISESTVYTLADVYWESRVQRRHLQKVISSEISSDDKAILTRFEKDFLSIEDSFKKSIKSYCEDFEVGRWALSQYGVGPITVVRLLRYVDVTKARSHEQLWAYAGLAPKSGPNQSYNSSLKDTCIDLGRSFIRYSDKSECFYGQLFNKELARRTQLNEQGAYSDLLKEESVFANKRIQHDVPEKLSADRLRSQAQRYAVKIFLVHWFSLDYQDTYGQEYLTANKNIVPIPCI